MNAVKRILQLILVFAALALLSGCNISTVDDFYCLPRRSEDYLNLQSAIDAVMTDLEYCAPISGENQQTVQMADLDGDGTDEYLLFAKGSTERPLQIFIFSQQGEEYVLVDTIESNGTAFEQVEYIHMGDGGGYELVVGRQVSDQVVRSVSVYSMADGQMEQVLATSYSRFVCTDLDGDDLTELLILRPGESDSGSGVAELYYMADGIVQRWPEVNMSEPADQVKRIMVSRLNDGTPAVYVASDAGSSAIITDVYAVVEDAFVNVSFSNESGTSVQTLRNYYVYADDIDDDGVLELPSLIERPQTLELDNDSQEQYLIRWYAMMPDGSEVDKLYTYHNFLGGWYLTLDGQLAANVLVSQMGNTFEFYWWDEEAGETELLFSVYVLTGQNREAQATANNRFVLYRNESTVYAARIEVASTAYGLSQSVMEESFHLILQDWNTGET